MDPLDSKTLDAMLTTEPVEKLNQMEHAVLYQARARASKEMQNKLAGPEHRAFAREATEENPLLALPIAVATLGYQPYKMLAGQSRSNASLDQVLQGLTGVGEGLLGYGEKKIEQLGRMIKS